jgi:hypothetical protein
MSCGRRRPIRVKQRLLAATNNQKYVAGLCDGTGAALRAGGMFGRHQSDIGHEVGC